MTDIRIAEGPQNLEAVTMDFLLMDTGLLDEREELATAFRVALGTDRLAAADEVLPDLDSTDRRGWWGDLDAEEIWDGWPIGCKNWLLTRAKITEAPSKEGSTLQRAKQYTQDALQPFIDKRIATRIETAAVRTELQRIEVTATAYRGPLAEVALRYQILWKEDAIVTNLAAPPSVVILPPVNNKLIVVPFRNLSLSSPVPTILVTHTPSPGNLVLSATPPSITKSPMPFRRTDWPNPRRRIDQSFLIGLEK